MSRVKLAALGFGAAFGFLISWGQFTDPDRIRDMLLLSDAYLYLMMFSAIAVGMAGSRLLRRRGAHALVTKQPIDWVTEKPQRRHVVGAATFGLGWALADSCPAPIAAQPALGVGWSVFTIVGVLAGVWLFLRRQEQAVPATRRASGPAQAAPAGAE